jgi:hypothetical protein
MHVFIFIRPFAGLINNTDLFLHNFPIALLNNKVVFRNCPMQLCRSVVWSVFLYVSTYPLKIALKISLHVIIKECFHPFAVDVTEKSSGNVDFFKLVLYCDNILERHVDIYSFYFHTENTVVSSNTLKANSHMPCHYPAMPCRINSHKPCHALAIFWQCRVLESPRGSRKYPNC